jgi:hypothetical protein
VYELTCWSVYADGVQFTGAGCRCSGDRRGDCEPKALPLPSGRTSSSQSLCLVMTPPWRDFACSAPSD